MEFNRKNDLHFSDYNLKNLILHIALSISRLLVAKPIEEYAIPEHEALRTLLERSLQRLSLTFRLSLLRMKKITFTPIMYPTQTSFWMRKKTRNTSIIWSQIFWIPSLNPITSTYVQI